MACRTPRSFYRARLYQNPRSIQHAAIGSALTSAGAAGAAGFFNGRMDEVRIWNVVRTQAEIQGGMGVEIPSSGGLIGRWGLDDGATLTATDSAGGGINGTLTPTANPPAWVVGAPFQNVAGAHGFDFNGTTNYVPLGDALGLGVTTFTLEAWIKREAVSTTVSTGTGGVVATPILTKGCGEAENSNVDMNFFLGLDATGRIVADYEEGAGQVAPGQNHPITGLTPIAVGNAWRHVAATFDGTTLRVYLDAVLDQTVTVGAGRLPRFDSIQDAAIGTALISTGVVCTNGGTGAGGFFNGVIDEARVWNYARSVEQILSGMGRDVPTASGLLGRWSLDELTQSTNTFTVSNTGSAVVTGTVIGAYGHRGVEPRGRQ